MCTIERLDSKVRPYPLSPENKPWRTNEHPQTVIPKLSRFQRLRPFHPLRKTPKTGGKSIRPGNLGKMSCDRLIFRKPRQTKRLLVN